jgi:chromosomal replication initiation ATPase DnaA
VSGADIARLEARIECLELAMAQVAPSPAFDRSISAIIRAAAYEIGVRPSDVRGDSKRMPLPRARFAIAWVARAVHGYSAARIGRALGGRDHTTICHALARAAELRDCDPAFRRLTNRMEEHFRKFNAEDL